MAELIDKTYGEALFQLSLEEGKVEQYADEVRSIKEAIAENPEFMVLLDHALRCAVLQHVWKRKWKL